MNETQDIKAAITAEQEKLADSIAQDEVMAISVAGAFALGLSIGAIRIVRARNILEGWEER